MTSGADIDRGESIGLMQPLLVPEGARHRAELTALAVELADRSAALRRRVPVEIRPDLSAANRIINCHCSNAIEGHERDPPEIDRALQGRYSADPRIRSLQLEAVSHIAVEAWIDAGGLRGRAATIDGICEIHLRFFGSLPEDLAWVADSGTGDRHRITPGALRRRDVAVGRHTPVSPGAVSRFLAAFERAYTPTRSWAEVILAIPAAHHRFVWIHPFLDGNGRMSRLMTHAMLGDAFGMPPLWSVSSALAYKAHLGACDLPRRNDLDGRGNLSQEALVAFTRYFLDVCLDEVTNMSRCALMDEICAAGRAKAAPRSTRGRR